jgi:hypothetical protein
MTFLGLEYKVRIRLIIKIVIIRNQNTEVRVEASISVFLVTGHAIGILVQTSDIFSIGITDIIISSWSLGQDHAANTGKINWVLADLIKNIILPQLLIVVDVNLSESPMRSLILLEVANFGVDLSKQLKYLLLISCLMTVSRRFWLIRFSIDYVGGIVSESNFATTNRLDGRWASTERFNSPWSSILLI